MPIDSGLHDVLALAMDSRYLWMPSSPSTFNTVRVLLHLMWSAQGLEQSFAHSDLALATGMRPKEVNDALGYMRSTRMVVRADKGRHYSGTPGLFVNWLLHSMLTNRPAAPTVDARSNTESLECPRCLARYPLDEADRLLTGQGTLACLQCNVEVAEAAPQAHRATDPFPIVDRFIERCMTVARSRPAGEQSVSSSSTAACTKPEPTVEFVHTFDEPVEIKSAVTWIGGEQRSGSDVLAMVQAMDTRVNSI